MRACDAALQILMESDNPSVMYGNEWLGHQITGRLGWDHAGPETSRRVLRALSKTPGRLVKALAMSAEILKSTRPKTTFQYFDDGIHSSDTEVTPQSNQADVVLIDELRDSSMAIRVFRWLQEGRTVWATVFAGTQEKAKERFADLLMQSFDVRQPAMADFARDVSSELMHMMEGETVACVLVVREAIDNAVQ